MLPSNAMRGTGPPPIDFTSRFDTDDGSHVPLFRMAYMAVSHQELFDASCTTHYLGRLPVDSGIIDGDCFRYTLQKMQSIVAQVAGQYSLLLSF